ncbi:MAG: hypothetical protein V3T17_20010 [Pseudomonadales bacterium]
MTITQGTKDGRNRGKKYHSGHRSERWVSVHNGLLTVLRQAAQLHDEKNLIPPGMSYIQWRDQAYNQWRNVTKGSSINGFHDMRAVYACERYLAITGFPAPVIADKRQASKTLDTQCQADYFPGAGPQPTRCDCGLYR